MGIKQKVTIKKDLQFILRYSHFDKLNDELKTLLGSSIPELPKKTFVSWFREKTDEEIDERR